MPIDKEVDRRKWRQDILLSGDFSAYFFNQTRRLKTDLAEILEEFQQVITAGYKADLNPLHDLRHCYSEFTWTSLGRSDIHSEQDLIRFVRSQDYIFLKYDDSSWRYGMIGAKSKKARLRLSICCGQEDPDLWEPLPSHNWVRITEMPEILD